MKKGRKIVFIHGYSADNSPSSTAELIIKEFGKDVVCCPDYNFRDALEANIFLQEYIANIFLQEYNEDIIIIGHSLGGFWANRMADIFQEKAILINPSLDPISDLMRHLDVDLDSYKKLNEIRFPNRTYKEIILGAKDDVIFPDKYSDEFKKIGRVHVDLEMGHRPTNTILIREIYSKM